MVYVVYQATVTQANTIREDIYIWITENEFKTRYYQHTSSFRLSHKSSATSLSEHIWKLKESNADQTLTRKILERAQPYLPTTGKCNLCTTEKAYIAYTHPSLNKRRELFSTCPHRRKHLLSNLKSEKAPSGSAPRPPEEDGPKWSFSLYFYCKVIKPSWAWLMSHIIYVLQSY